MKVNKKTGLLIRFVERAKLENIPLRAPAYRQAGLCRDPHFQR